MLYTFIYILHPQSGYYYHLQMALWRNWIALLIAAQGLLRSSQGHKIKKQTTIWSFCGFTLRLFPDIPNSYRTFEWCLTYWISVIVPIISQFSTRFVFFYFTPKTMIHLQLNHIQWWNIRLARLYVICLLWIFKEFLLLHVSVHCPELRNRLYKVSLVASCNENTIKSKTS
jgi:hypothetical protein